jgi:hypothetical protein
MCFDQVSCLAYSALFVGRRVRSAGRAPFSEQSELRIEVSVFIPVEDFPPDGDDPAGGRQSKTLSDINDFAGWLIRNSFSHEIVDYLVGFFGDLIALGENFGKVRSNGRSVAAAGSVFELFRELYGGFELRWNSVKHPKFGGWVWNLDEANLHSAIEAFIGRGAHVSLE